MKLIRGALLVLMVLYSPIAHAVTSASIQNFLPAISETPYLTLSRSGTLEPWQFHTGFTLNYEKEPLLRGTDTIVDDLLMADIFGSIGILDWWEVGLGLPVALRNDSANLTTIPTTVGGVVRTKDFGLGDLRLESKFRILDQEEYGLGIAALPFVSFPTGDESHFVGNGNFSGGAAGVLDFSIKERAEIALNAAFLIREQFLFPGTGSTTQAPTEWNEQYLIGLGLSIHLTEWLDLMGEMTGRLLARDPFREVESPLEGGAGVRVYLPWLEGLQASLGGNVGLTAAYGAPVYRIYSGVSYTRPAEEEPPPPAPVEPEPPPPPPPPEKIEIKRKIHFESGKATVRVTSGPLLNDVVKTLNEHPEVRQVEIQGHSDGGGPEAANIRMSIKRADAVRQYLLSQGIEERRLVVKGYGSSQPIEPNETDLGRAKNRRVEFKVLVQDNLEPPPPTGGASGVEPPPPGNPPPP